MPLMESLRSGSAAALARAAELLREDEALLDALARAELEGMRLGGGLAYDAGRLAELPTALGRRVVRLAAAEALAEGGPWAPGARQVETVLDLARERRGGQVDLGDRCIARVKAGELTFERS
jgi:tRNA(Ile)-lysidine synthase